jgi:hypothetical protein
VHRRSGILSVRSLRVGPGGGQSGRNAAAAIAAADNDAATCHAIFFLHREERPGLRARTRFIDYLFIELDVFTERLAVATYTEKYIVGVREGGIG